MKKLLVFVCLVAALLAWTTPSWADLTCEGQPNVKILVLDTDGGAGQMTWTTAFAANPGIDSIGFFDMSAATPTAGDFSGYDMAIVVIYLPPDDPVAAGNALAAFAATHPVIVTGAGFDTLSGFGVTGGMTALSPITAGVWNMGVPTSMGTNYSAHPALAGVTSYDEQYWQTSTLNYLAEPIAFYNDANTSVMLAQLDNVLFFNAILIDGVIAPNALTILYNSVLHMWCKQDRPIRAALIQDTAPWFGGAPMEHYLKHRHVPYDIIASAGLGSADLSLYDFIVISGAQSNAFYVTLNADAAGLEAWVNAGGILLFDSATTSSEWPTGVTLPTGIEETLSLQNALLVNLATHKLVTYPYDVSAPSYYAGWGNTIHGYYSTYNAGNGGEEVLQTADGNAYPVLVHYQFGHGHVVTDTTTVEYRMGDSALFDWFFGENLLSYLPPIAGHLDVFEGNVDDNPLSTGVTGFNFWDGATNVTVSDIFMKTTLPVSNVVVDHSSHLSFDVDLTGAHCQNYSVLVDTPLGESFAIDDFAVTSPAIVVDAASPDHGAVGDTVNATVSGNYFYDQSLTVTLTGPGTINGTNIIITGPTSLTVDFDLTGATPGSYTLAIHNDCSDGSKADAFTVDEVTDDDTADDDTADDDSADDDITDDDIADDDTTTDDDIISDDDTSDDDTTSGDDSGGGGGGGGCGC